MTDLEQNRVGAGADQANVSRRSARGLSRVWVLGGLRPRGQCRCVWRGSGKLSDRSLCQAPPEGGAIGCRFAAHKITLPGATSRGTVETSPDSLILADSGRPAVRYWARKRQGRESASRRRAAGGADAAAHAWMSWWDRSTCSAPGRRCATRSSQGMPHSAILYGPPGAGKTTLARIAAARAEGAFEEQSAVNAGKAEIRAVIERARERRGPRAGRRSSSSTRSIASTRRSRTRCCRRSRKGC